ncbi:hypothetical protein YQE_13080, partial [Dendroctonus ponderosae]
MSSLNIKFALASKDDGIVYLHESNVIHRDVKGSNILLTKEGEVKLCDFGLGKNLTQNDDKLYDCVGSSCWMAPELVTANKEDSEKGFYDNRNLERCSLSKEASRRLIEGVSDCRPTQDRLNLRGRYSLDSHAAQKYPVDTIKPRRRKTLNNF